MWKHNRGPLSDTKTPLPSKSYTHTHTFFGLNPETPSSLKDHQYCNKHNPMLVIFKIYII